jgi:hypothetical protein
MKRLSIIENRVAKLDLGNPNRHNLESEKGKIARPRWTDIDTPANRIAIIGNASNAEILFKYIKTIITKKITIKIIPITMVLPPI